MGPGDCGRLQARISGLPRAGQITCHQGEPGSGRQNIHRSQRYVRERSNPLVARSFESRVLFNDISSTKEGWPDETGSEPPSSQPVPPLPTLQYGGNPRSKGSPSAGRLDEQDRSQRCVIPIDMEYRKYLRFRWQGQAYEFTCLPFGLATAPRIFTKLLRPVVGFLRSHGVRCVIYLNDLLIMQHDRDVLVEHTATVVHLLEALGFLVNYPRYSIFWDLWVDSLKRELRLPLEKLAHLKQEARLILKGEYASARKLAQLLGKMSAAVLAVQPAPLHYRELQHLKHTALKIRYRRERKKT